MRISLVYFALLVGAGVFGGWIWYEVTTRFTDYSVQFLNWELAEHYRRQFGDVLLAPIDPVKIQQRLHELAELNPGADPYLLGKDGTVYFAVDNVATSKIDPAPLERFVFTRFQELSPIRAINPRGRAGKNSIYTIFSAAPADIGGKPGYVFVVLRSELYWKVYRVFGEYNMLRGASAAVALAFSAVGLLGFLIFWIMTRRFRALTAAVSHFGHGRYHERIEVVSEDEVGELGRAFNEMADTIERSVKALEDNDRLRRNLVANVSHDLRSPLTTIQGFLQMLQLKHSAGLNEEGRQFVRMISKSTNQLRTLADSLFELSKLEAKESGPALERLRIEEFAADMLLKLHPQAAEKGVELELIEPDNEMPQALADPIFLDRLITNLLDNAIRHTPPGGKVTISFQPASARILVRVSDTGEGIPTDALEHVFDQFYQVDPDTKISGGSGLGLAISQKIVEAHGGAITVESIPGEGTTFQFDLPAVVQPPRAS